MQTEDDERPIGNRVVDWIAGSWIGRGAGWIAGKVEQAAQWVGDKARGKIEKDFGGGTNLSEAELELARSLGLTEEEALQQFHRGSHIRGGLREDFGDIAEGSAELVTTEVIYSVTGGVAYRALRHIPGSRAHKRQRWKDYQERGGGWSYERWSAVYDDNMVKATRARQAVARYRGRIGWGRMEVTVEVEPGVVRRLDIADVGRRRAIEHKTGYQYLSAELRGEIRRDKLLRDQGWDLTWHFEGTASTPLQRELDAVGIPHNLVSRR